MTRANVKRQISQGSISAADLVTAEPTQPELESMPIGALLLAQRRWGIQRTQRLLDQVPVSANRTVGSLTRRQRQFIALKLNA